MSLREQKIKEIAEALESADDKILAVVYTLTMLTTEHSERTITHEEAEEIKEKKPAPAKPSATTWSPWAPKEPSRHWLLERNERSHIRP